MCGFKRDIQKAAWPDKREFIRRGHIRNFQPSRGGFKRGEPTGKFSLPSQYKSADRLIQKARSTMGNNPYYPDEGDTIWCVFDRDDNTNTMLRTAQTQATKEGYKIIFSNPSFELWYLFHFTDQNSAIEDSDSVIRLLKRNSGMEQYEKSNDVYDILKPLQGDAMMRAKRRLSLLEASGAELLCRESNPVTSVCELVEYLYQHK